MFWAAFGYSKRTELATMPGDPASARGGVSAYWYIEVLEEYIPTILETDTFFIYNNVQKILKAKIIKLYPELITINDNNATRQFLIRAAKEV
ncbi:hypothetical protein OIDMADRAFT_20716 [Oidiodendron maius Zn]|uniref:Uncharacterized protein n=1 Tax=Oidiodendron maius (strain Zn) TaxID=913774 RepID=A0A0C3CBH0_OIDMZ|nr:hypothetical protein OIDMADRAFT_20716 [Oidiodendron maius Zn]